VLCCFLKHAVVTPSKLQHWTRDHCTQSKTYPSATLSTKIPHGMAWDHTQASTVGDLVLTTWAMAWSWTRRRKCEWLCSHLYWCVYISLEREREKDEACLPDSTPLCFFARATLDFIVVHSDYTSVDSNCKTHVHSILKTVNFFQCISHEKLPKKDKRVQIEYV
jgi:hypothetical protein